MLVLLMLAGAGWWWRSQLQLQQEQPQAVPHLQVVQSQPPFSPAISNPPEVPLWVAAAMIMVVVAAVASTSGNILHPPQPEPHWQPEPHPHLPPQQDILRLLVGDATEETRGRRRSSEELE